MLRERPYIIDGNETSGECACYMNPIGTYMCPKCWRKHQVIGSGALVVESSTVHTSELIVAPIICAQCACGYRGELIPMYQDLADPISALSLAGYAVQSADVTDTPNEYIIVTIAFHEAHAFKTLPVGFVLQDNILTGRGPEKKIFENLDAWTKTLKKVK